jgi:hypothetical protein
LTASIQAQVPATQKAGAAQRLLPIDDTRGDRALRELRNRLLSAVASQEIAQLEPLLADYVYAEFDGMPRDEFIKRFQRGSAETRTRFWQELRDALLLGVAQEPGRAEACAPYTYRRIPSGDRDEQVLLAVTGSHVAVRDLPQANSLVIERLSHDIVELGPQPEQDEASDGYSWVHIKTPSGRLGWVLSRYVRANSSPRFCFQKYEGRWRLYAFATTGD